VRAQVAAQCTVHVHGETQFPAKPYFLINGIDPTPSENSIRYLEAKGVKAVASAAGSALGSVHAAITRSPNFFDVAWCR
jgi:hypothetical protein